MNKKINNEYYFTVFGFVTFSSRHIDNSVSPLIIAYLNRQGSNDDLIFRYFTTCLLCVNSGTSLFLIVGTRSSICYHHCVIYIYIYMSMKFA